MVKALFVGYLFGIRSEPSWREIDINVALSLFPKPQAFRSGVRRLDAQPEPAAAL
jgi:hypothetical protein